MAHPRTPEEVYQDYTARKAGLRRALTDDQEEFYRHCDPEKENLCLYGEPDGRWVVDLPAEEVPAELPEPCLGINFARDGMARKDWLALVAVHSDAWLMSVAFYYGAKLDQQGRAKLFRLINQEDTLYEMVTGKRGTRAGVGGKRKAGEAGFEATVGPAASARAAEAPMPSGRLLTTADIGTDLKGRQAELFWPDDKMWYLVEIHSINARSRMAKIQYTSGEFEELDLDEIIREGHMSVLP